MYKKTHPRIAAEMGFLLLLLYAKRQPATHSSRGSHHQLWLTCCSAFMGPSIPAA